MCILYAYNFSCVKPSAHTQRGLDSAFITAKYVAKVVVQKQPNHQHNTARIITALDKAAEHSRRSPPPVESHSLIYTNYCFLPAPFGVIVLGPSNA